MSGQASLFDVMCQNLEQQSELNTLQARGAIRLVLRDAGLDASELTKRQALVLIDKLLPDRLARHGIATATAETIGATMHSVVEAIATDTAADGPDAMLRRLDAAMGTDS